MSDSATLATERQGDIYWRTVRATLETVFNEDPDQIAPMEKAYRDGPPMDRAVLYNMEPLELAAEFLDVTPTEAQRGAYKAVVDGLLAVSDQSTLSAPSTSGTDLRPPAPVLKTHRLGRTIDIANQGNRDSVIRNVRIKGSRTSLRMEAIVWDVLLEICRVEGLTIHQLCSQIYKRKPEGASLTAAIRVFIIAYFKETVNVAATAHKEETRQTEANKETKEALHGTSHPRLIFVNVLHDLQKTRLSTPPKRDRRTGRA